MSPVQALPPELARATHVRVSLLSTLSHESTGSSAIEGLWGTLDRWTDRLRGNPGSEGGGGGGRAPSIPLQPRNSATLEPPGFGAAKKRGRIGPWGRHRCSLLQPIAPACRAGDVSRRYSLPRRPFANVGVAGSSPVSCSRNSEGPIASCAVGPFLSHYQNRRNVATV
jgi:hypothetical protein